MRRNATIRPGALTAAIVRDEAERIEKAGPPPHPPACACRRCIARLAARERHDDPAKCPFYARGPELLRG